MNLKHLILGSALLLLPLKSQDSIIENNKQLYETLSKNSKFSRLRIDLFPIADILAQGNKFRPVKFQEDLFKENAEYLTDTVSFEKVMNTERTEENPFPRTIDPLEMDLKSENLRESERAAFVKLREETRKHRDRYYNGELANDEITRQELSNLNKGVYVLINPNNDDFEHNDSLIHNPQLIIVINEFERTITKMPVSVSRYGVKKNREGTTPSGFFSIQTHFDVNESLVAGVETREANYLDAAHSRIHGDRNGTYKLPKDYYEKRGATMVKGLVTIGPGLEYISTPSAEGNISRKRGIFIHGSNSLKARTFGKNASNGCIRMHPVNRDALQKKLIFGKPYKLEDGERTRLTASSDTVTDASTRNNKIIFERTQSHDQEYFFTAGSPLYIMEEE